MPPVAACMYPSASAWAPENDPFRAPNSRRSARPSGTVEQLTATNGPDGRGPARWKVCAACSLPEPLSRWTCRTSPVPATRSMAAQVCWSAGPATLPSATSTRRSWCGRTSSRSRNSESPARSTAPGATSAFPSMVAQSSRVPFRLPWSRTTNRPARNSTWEWRRDRQWSSRRTPGRLPLPSIRPSGPRGMAACRGSRPENTSTSPGAGVVPSPSPRPARASAVRVRSFNGALRRRRRIPTPR